MQASAPDSTSQNARAANQQAMNLVVESGLGWVYGEKKMYREATAELEKAVNLSNRREDLTVAVLGKVLGDSGRKQEARKLLEELEGQSKHRYVSPYRIALLQIGLGERDGAIASLEQGYNGPRSNDDVAESGPAGG